MAPKGNKPKAKAEDSAKRRRIQGKSRADLDQCDADDADAAAMPKAEISAMLGYLKYHADPLKEKNMDLLAASQKALVTYAALGKNSKPDFLSKFNKSKKDLGWVNSFEESTTHLQESHEEVEEGEFFGSYILKEMGFDTHSLTPEKYQKYLDKIIKESEAKYEYKVKVQEDEDDFMLNKYSFKFIGKTKHRAGTSESSKLAGTADVTKAVKDAVGPAKVEVKIENQSYIDLLNQVRVLKSGKGALEKKLALMTDKMTCLKKHMERLGTKITRVELAQEKDWGLAIGNMTTAVNEIRDVLYEAGLLDATASVEDLQHLKGKVEGMIKEAAVHEAAAKLVTKDMRGFTQI